MADPYPLSQYAGSVESSQSTATATAGHKRGYQACMPCRKRKVRCDLGPVDNPHDPPCVRCRREAKECTFAATRRKRRPDGEEDGLGDDEDEIATHLARRKSARTGSVFDERYTSPQNDTRSIGSGSLPPPSPFNPYHQSHNARYAHSQHNDPSPILPKTEGGQDQELTNEAAAELLHGPINNPGDALHLLLEASGQSENVDNQGTSRHRQPHRHTGQGFAGGSNSATLSAHNARQASNGPMSLDPAITGYIHKTPTPSREALSIWSRLRFVRAGWFTAREAMAYID